MKSDVKLDKLRHLAARIVESGAADEEIERLLPGISDISGLLDLAQDFTPHPEVSIPVYRRLLELRPDDAAVTAQLGWVFWLCGEDDKAKEQAALASRFDPDNLDTLLLKATLEPRSDKKRLLYQRVLKCDPGNAIAAAKLRKLNG